MCYSWTTYLVIQCRCTYTDYTSTILFILSAAKVISFSQLCRLLSPAAKEASVLKCVQQYAVLVQGCWVVKRWESSTGYKCSLGKLNQPKAVIKPTHELTKLHHYNCNSNNVSEWFCLVTLLTVPFKLRVVEKFTWMEPEVAHRNSILFVSSCSILRLKSLSQNWIVPVMCSVATSFAIFSVHELKFYWKP